MHPKNPLFQKCLTYLESLPSITAAIQGESYFSSKVLADGKLIIRNPAYRTHLASLKPYAIALGN